MYILLGLTRVRGVWVISSLLLQESVRETLEGFRRLTPRHQTEIVAI